MHERAASAGALALAFAACSLCFTSLIQNPAPEERSLQSPLSAEREPKNGPGDAASLPLVLSAVAGLAALVGCRGERRALANRREAILACSLPLSGLAAPEAAKAQAQYQLDNRTAYLREKARILNFAADWYLFDVKPLVHPTENLVSAEVCKEMGQTCPDVKSLAALREMYKANVASNAGAGAVVSKFERDVLYPMKDVSLSNAVDPDTSEELQEIFQKFEVNQFQLGKAAREENLTLARKKFDEGRVLMNNFFSKIDASVGLNPSDEIYFAPIPVDNKATDTDKYWIRRGQRWDVKKKVDMLSKSNKTARFYAKSIFGDIAEGLSWDLRGDRAADFYESGENKGY